MPKNAARDPSTRRPVEERRLRRERRHAPAVAAPAAAAATPPGPAAARTGGRTIHSHIGMHKTGTTSIQDTLSGLVTDRIAYVDLSRPNHSATYATMFMADPEEFTGHRRMQRSVQQVMELRAAHMARLEASIRAAGERNMITSGEGISLLSREELSGMRAFFARHFDEIRIIAYVRPPASYMASALQQRIVGGLKAQFKTLYPKYRDLFEKFDQVFGRKNVTLVKFDRGEMVEGNVVLDFSRRVGLELDRTRLAESNIGLSLEGTAVMFAHRRHGQQELESRRDRIDNQRVARTIGGIGRSKLQLHEDIVRPVIEAHRADMDWIEARLGTSLAETYSREPTALTSNAKLSELAGAQLGPIGALLAEALAATPSDPVLTARSVDFLYEIYQCQRKHKRSARRGKKAVA
jgi:hypothetical protein